MQEKDRVDEVKKTARKAERLPLVALRGVVPYPNLALDFEVGREESQKAVELAVESDRRILLTAQRDQSIVRPAEQDLYTVGVMAEIQQVMRGRGTMRVLVICRNRVQIIRPVLSRKTGCWTASMRRMANYAEDPATPAEETAAFNLLRSVLLRHCNLMHRYPAEYIDMLISTEKPRTLFEAAWSNSDFDYHERQAILEANTLTERMNLLVAALAHRNEVLSAEQELTDKIMSRAEANQREMFLREQMQIISEELGEGPGAGNDQQFYADKIRALPLSEEVREKLLKEANQLTRMPAGSQEAYVISNYLDTVLALPWGTYTKEKGDITKAAALLDREHYGLKRVKERVLESMSVHVLQPELTGQIICLVGPPGVGKTSVAQSVAKALGRKYVRVSLGGVRDEAEIRGHRKTYVAAMPGRIMEAVRQAGSMNPLILLDEIDKLSGDFKGDPAAALLEVLDSAQNHAFRDHYLEIPFDLSRVLFLTTANDASQIPGPLYDRMDVIELNSYTREEKFHIAKEHLVRKQLKANGLTASQMRLTDAAVYDLIDYYTKEAGVRSLERQIASLCRKCAKRLLTENVKKVVYTPESVEAELGPHKYQRDYYATADTVGLVNGLAWTSVGGVLMPLEVLTMDGKGDVRLTGSLGEVMKESAGIAFSYARSVARQYDINPDLFKTKDLHIHAPEGAVPKDGPSAGVTMLTALISALSGRSVRHDIAMTGEITLHGRVLPIGGLVEKSMAAYKNGIRTVLIPQDNLPDLAELDETVRSAIHFIPCDNVRQVLDTALVPLPQYDITLEPLHEEDAKKVVVPPKKQNTRLHCRPAAD